MCLYVENKNVIRLGRYALKQFSLCKKIPPIKLHFNKTSQPSLKERSIHIQLASVLLRARSALHSAFRLICQNNLRAPPTGGSKKLQSLALKPADGSSKTCTLKWLLFTAVCKLGGVSFRQGLQNFRSGFFPPGAAGTINRISTRSGNLFSRSRAQDGGGFRFLPQRTD